MVRMKGKTTPMNPAISTQPLHICGTTNDGKLWHTTRSMQGSAESWSPWEEIKPAAASLPGPFIRVSCTSIMTPQTAELHIFGVIQGGKLLHTSRPPQKDWQPFEDLEIHIGRGWGTYKDVAVTRNNLQLCALALTKPKEQRILYTTRGNRTWDSFQDVNRTQLAGFPGSFSSISCEIGKLGELHVCGITDDGKLWYTNHFFDPPWLPFTNVSAITKNAPKALKDVSIAEVSGTLHVFVQAGGNLWHTTRSTDPPYWQSTFDDIKQQASNPGTFDAISCTAIGTDHSSELHVCGLTNDGKLWHTFLSSASTSPKWQPFEDLTAIIGNPGHLSSVSSTNEPIFTLEVPEGYDPTCDQYNACIDNDMSMIEYLQQQGVSNGQIQGLQDDIASVRQQAQDYGCQSIH